ncbi:MULTISPECIES: hypothetical protein [Oxalobacteraceae]|uniref:hypothetical protein n=1 Tax=Herminiimonas sp. Marseille-P9896 TaxID=2742211 RepID=UPI00158BE0FB|nr:MULTISPECIES: hypothetical protein [Oxalobacteraceae]
MKASDLVNLWSAPDNSRLTAKQLSFRLPVEIAAKLSALCELYPNKNRTEIVGDLLRSAIADVEKALPSYAGAYVDKHPDTGEEMYREEGVKAKFRELANKYHRELEVELGNESPRKLYDGNYCTHADKA